ncbi:methyltransferase domain-containing protein [archaeon]|jgi:tRNA (uracil-5-)-methyltransferase TRM9|nr:methyltransferase domain-containing protein [archaeon]MBT7128547.1 methyltransferase domain-containing protein [archaeon]
MKQEEVWDAIARPWKEFRQYDVSDVVEFLKNKKGRVLDLGCGSGRNFYDIEGLDFYGVDFSEKMVELAGARGYVEVKKAGVDAVPYDDGFFDCVIFSAVLHCVDSAEKRRKALEEVFRVLKNGGEALVSVWGRGQKRLKNRAKEGFVPWSVGSKKVERYTYIYDVDELRSELESVGFEILKVEEGRNIVFVVRKE